MLFYSTTAYGAFAPVPGDVDLLVAGTSCVDYSNLNNEKKGIDGGGESGRTFHGMMSWVENHRPPIVILENVCSAPWEKVKEYFESQSYSAEFMRLDTKQYYIPHTRTRVYLLAVDKRSSQLPAGWKNWVTKLRRPASSTLDAFLLPSDDSRIHQAREKLVQDSGVSESRSGRIDWTRCESRHARARLEESLGPKRPLTNWEEGELFALPCSPSFHFPNIRWCLSYARLCLARLGRTPGRTCLGPNGHQSPPFCENWRGSILQNVRK